MAGAPPPPPRDGARRKPSRRRRGAPARYSDDKPDTVTYDRQYGDGRGGEAGGGTAAAASAAVAGSKRSRSRGGTPEPGGPGAGGYDHNADGKNGDGARQRRRERRPKPKPNGAIAHRVSVLPALRYVRPPHLHAAAEALAAYTGAPTSSGAPTASPSSATAPPPTKAVSDANDAPEISSSRDSKAQPIDQKSRRASDIRDEEEQRAKAERENRRRDVLERLRRDPSLSAAFGAGLGLLTRKAQDKGKLGSGGGTAGTAQASAAAPDWDAVRYNDFYYPGDFIEEEEEAEEEKEEGGGETKDVGSKDAVAAREGATNASVQALKPQAQTTFRPRKRLRPGVLHPIPRAVTVMAMTPLRPPSDADHDMSRNEDQRFRYVAIGDTAGFVTLYVTEPILSSVSRLDTSASQRDYEEELERRRWRAMGKKGSRDIGGLGGGSRPSSASTRPVTADSTATDQSPSLTTDRLSAVSAALDEQLRDDDDDVRSDSVMSAASSMAKAAKRYSGGKKKSDTQSLASTSPNAVEALCFTCTGKKIVVGTKVEVELIDCLTNSILWTIRTDHLYGMSSSSLAAAAAAAGAVDGSGGGGADIDAMSSVRLSRGAPIQLSCHPSEEDGGILAGYVFSAFSSADERALRLATEEKVSGVHQDGSLVSPLLQFSTATDETNQAVNAVAAGIIPFEEVDQEGTVPQGGGASTSLVIGPRSVAMYDLSNPKRILMVCLNLRPRAVDIETTMQAQQRGREKSGHKDKAPGPPPQHLQELLLLDTSSAPAMVVSRAILPARMAGSKIVTSEAIAQSPRGRYTVAATAARGGIRLYLTEGLEHLATYGEGVALHGHTIMWQDLFFLPRGGPGQEVERDDEVLHRTSSSSSKKRVLVDDPADLMLVAIPHAFREPLDLNGTIHFWDLADVLWGGTKLPCTTIRAPPRSAGVATLLFDNRSGLSNGNRMGGVGRFILSTQTGDCRELGPKLVSDWPGRMYPPGYTVLDDNVEYIEDEDELDIVVDGPDSEYPDGTHASVDHGMAVHSDDDGHHGDFDSDLKAALKRSMCDEDAVIDVIGDEDNVQGQGLIKVGEAPTSGGECLVAARPEAYLQARIASEDANGDSSSAAGLSHCKSDVVDVLNLLPQIKEIEPLVEKNFARESVKNDDDQTAPEVQSSVTPAVSLSKSARGKRIKAGSLEAILNASIDPKVRAALLRRELWSDGSGSTRRQITLAENDANKVCAACLGRSVHHRCGKLQIPVDEDAAAQAEAERKEKEEEEKRQRRLAKKRVTDAKRRETKRRKKKEEEEEREAEEQAEKERREQELCEIEEEERRRMERIRKKEAARLSAMAMEEEERTRAAVAVRGMAGGGDYWGRQYNQATYNNEGGAGMSSQEEKNDDEEERRTIALELQNLRAGFGTASSVPVPAAPIQPQPSHQNQYQYQQQQQLPSYGTYSTHAQQFHSSTATSSVGPTYVASAQQSYPLATATPVAAASAKQAPTTTWSDPPHSQNTSTALQQVSGPTSMESGPDADASVGRTASSSSVSEPSQQVQNTSQQTHYNSSQDFRTPSRPYSAPAPAPAAAVVSGTHQVPQAQSTLTVPVPAAAPSSARQYPANATASTRFAETSAAPVASTYVPATMQPDASGYPSQQSSTVAAAPSVSAEVASAGAVTHTTANTQTVPPPPPQTGAEHQSRD